MFRTDGVEVSPSVSHRWRVPSVSHRWRRSFIHKHIPISQTQMVGSNIHTPIDLPSSRELYREQKPSSEAVPLLPRVLKPKTGYKNLKKPPPYPYLWKLGMASGRKDWT